MTTPSGRISNEPEERKKEKNNIFEFMGQLYRQTSGSAIGQKQAPPVACLWAGILERKFLNKPREIVF